MEFGTTLVNKTLLEPMVWDKEVDNGVEIWYLGYPKVGTITDDDNSFIIAKITNPTGIGRKEFAQGKKEYAFAWSQRKNLEYSFLK